jgi:predicted nucleic acid-binding Zn ribbon protein
MLRPLKGMVRSWSGEFRAPSDPLIAIEGVWDEVAGPEIAPNAQPSRVRAGELLLVTVSSAWSQQLDILAPQILRALAARVPEAKVERLRFRTGRVVAPRPAPARPAARRLPVRHCQDCGVGLERDRTRCAPCEDGQTERRRVKLARLLYESPWLHFVRLCVEIPGLTRDDYDRTRTMLLDRWETALERAVRAKRLSGDGYERRIASSYVMLHSALPPERITAAIEANVLGAEVYALLRGAEGSRPASKSGT